MHRFRTAVLLTLLAPWACGVEVTTVDGQSLSGDLVAIDANSSVTVRVEGKARRIAGEDLLLMTFRRDAQEKASAPSRVIFRNGDALPGVIAGGSGTALVIDQTPFGKLECPLAAIARVELAGPVPATQQPAESLDALIFLNGERIDGALQAFGEKGLTFKSEHLGQLELDFGRIAAVLLARKAGRAPERPEGVTAIVHTDDGGSLTGKLVGFQDGRLRLETLLGPMVTVETGRTLRAEFRGGRLVYLSDLHPASVEQTPYFDIVWPYRRDRSIDNHPLRLDGAKYAKGLSMHSRCRLTYRLNGEFKTFLALVGIDEEVGERGNADVQVVVDGQVKFERRALRGRDAAIAVEVDVAGAKTLTLVADFGAELDICDHVTWADARLIR